MGAGLAPWLFVLVCVHAVLCGVTASRALDWVRRTREQPLRLMAALGAVAAAIGVAALVLATHGPGGEDTETVAGGLFAGVVSFGTGTLTLGLRSRLRMLSLVAGLAVGAVAVALPLGLSVTAALGSGLAVLFGAGFIALTCAFSVWLLTAVYELDEARETRARLAVAEERLRFGRDLHDVMGRNLAVIALEERAGGAAGPAGRPEAVDADGGGAADRAGVAAGGPGGGARLPRGRLGAANSRARRACCAPPGSIVRGHRGSGRAAGVRCSPRSAGWCGRARRTCCGTGMPGGARWGSGCGEGRVVLTWRTTGSRGAGPGGRVRAGSGSGARAVAGVGRGRACRAAGAVVAPLTGGWTRGSSGAGDDRLRVVATVPLPAGSGAGSGLREAAL